MGTQDPIHASPSTDIESNLSDTEYPIKCILEESRDKYLIAWERDYDPSWEPKHFVNDAAVHAWELKKNNRYQAADRYRREHPLRKSHLSYINSLSQSSPSSTLSASNSGSQISLNSGSVFAPQSTQQSYSSISDQGGSLGKNSFYQIPYSLATQSSVTFSTQHQRPLSQSGAENWISPPELANSPHQCTQAGVSSNSPENSLQPFQATGGLSRSEDPAEAPYQVIDLSQQANSLDRQSLTTSGNSLERDYRLSSPRTRSPKKRPSRLPLIHGGITQSLSLTPRSQRQNLPTTKQIRAHTFSQEVAETPLSQLWIGERIEDLLSDSGPLSTSQFDPLIPSNNTPDNLFAWKTPYRRQALSDGLSIVPETVYSNSTNAGEHLGSHPFIEESIFVSQGPSSKSRLSKTVQDSDRSRFGKSPKQLKNSPHSSEHPLYTMEESSSNGSSQPAKSVAEAARNNPGTSYLERMRYLRAAERASIKPLQSLTESETPSSAGDIEASAPPATSEGVIPLSVRHDKEPPVREDHQTDSPVSFVAPQALHYNPEQPALLGETGARLIDTASLSTPAASLELAAQQFEQEGKREEQAIEEHQGISLGPFEFVIPLSMDSRVKDDYDRTLREASKCIRRFVASASFAEGTAVEVDVGSLALQMQRMIEQLNNITTHPDLNLPDQPSSGPLDVAKEASWAEYSSSKFQFLSYFMDAVLEDPLERAIHVIVMVKPGAAVDIMRKYFLGKQLDLVPSEEPGNQQLVFVSRHLSFQIFTVEDKSPAASYKDPTVIVALDNAFSADDPLVRKLRTTGSSGRLVPAIRLIISNTAEHIALCLPKCCDFDRLRLLVQYTNSYSSIAGDLQDDALGVQENAEETLRYLMSDPDTREWPLADVETVEILTPDQASSLEPEELCKMSISRQKRWLDDEGDDAANSSKRQRTTPLQDITHINDSVKGPSQENQEASRLNVQVELDSDAMLQINELRSALADARKRLRAMETNFAKLQHRYESKNERYHKTRRELEQSAESAKKSETRIERQKGEINKLKDERSELTKELQEARDIVKAGGGLAADLEIAREEIRKLSQEKSNLERTAQQERSQSEFTRLQYQNASSAAAQSGIEVRQLKEQVEELERKCNGEAAKLKQLRAQNNEQQHLDRIRELENSLMTREKLLMMKEEEIRDLRKNRPTTRSTSTQPRSPKFAGSSRPASPAPNLGSNSNTIGRGSVLRFRVEP
ncbi:uncharacterized protein CIMG_06550 [Coccidioides immitis RS]|uniref:HDA1 complex subunit n=2 Tax=Coccidioides immitis TaxID=5501 RepID=J3K8D6_COCIM|nr:uncharacterized protein CIMG_06550 [Coccidioides immitis RS]EAS31071.3 hypothetical protein CIMG_06550 [Coccidioides immitis RS]